MTAAEHIREVEEQVRMACDAGSPLFLAIMYRQLYALGYRISTIDAEIRRRAQDAAS